MYTQNDVTVIISTKDRPEQLKLTILSLLELDEQPNSIFISDNSVENNAREVLEAFTHVKGLRWYHLPEPGKCRCLNFLLDIVETEICLFTDDDVRVPKNWISEMVNTLNTKGVIAVQGEIHIPSEYAKYKLSDRDRKALGEVRNKENEFHASPFLIGANMAVVWSRCKDLRFDTLTGPGAYGYMDDTNFYLDLLDRGESFSYCMCPVEHYFPLDRILAPKPRQTAIKHAISTAYVSVKRGDYDQKLNFLKLMIGAIRVIACYVRDTILRDRFRSRYASAIYSLYFMVYCHFFARNHT
jgi:glycosyltransferase involved in cell wall biosynthesis